MKRKIFGVASHKDLGLRKQHHAFLRRILAKAKGDDSNITRDYAFIPSVKATKDTTGLQGIGPTLLVFEISRHPQPRPQPLSDIHD